MILSSGRWNFEPEREARLQAAAEKQIDDEVVQHHRQQRCHVGIVLLEIVYQSECLVSYVILLLAVVCRFIFVYQCLLPMLVVGCHLDVESVIDYQRERGDVVWQ